MNINKNKIYTLTEVSEYLQVTQRTLYNYIKDEKIKAFKIGNYWRVSGEELENFLNSLQSK